MATSPLSGSPAPGDSYAQGIGNAQASLSFADNLFQFGRPLLEAFLSDRADRKVGKEAKKRLQRYMGPWYSHVMIDDKLARQPVLRARPFQIYLEDTDGVLKPDGLCEATASWVLFLHVMGITPDTRVKYRNDDGIMLDEPLVYLRPLAMDPKIASAATGFLEVPGEVICHLINLYGIPNDLANRADDSEKEAGTSGLATLHGEISWSKSSQRTNQLDLRYEHDDSRFSNKDIQHPYHDRYTDEGTLILRYFDTIKGEHGINPGSLALPNPESPLHVRTHKVRSVIVHMRLESRSSKVVIMSPLWWEAATRIARRATTNGGADMGLLQDILSFCKNQCVNSGICGPSDDVPEAIQNAVKHGFMFEHDDYRLYLLPPRVSKNKGKGRLESAPQQPMHPKPAGDLSQAEIESMYAKTKLEAERKVIMQELPKLAITETLKSYANMPNFTWNRQLFEARDSLLWLMMRGKEIWYESSKVWLIPEFTMPDGMLWEATLMLQ